ncbi:MAG: exopolyphosphatase [Hyphomicrobiales bacterium]|nr:exopolyphosphatase [Hyphomicrobiales bacterium]MCP5373801.1 exopolyphosphatase [Hyphomicrobiales bacterium]
MALLPRPDTRRLGVVDIGSNTVRMVVYDAPDGMPIPMFNEKAQCELGRHLAETGRLNPEGVKMAQITLARFVGLAEAMGLAELDFVATAAVRDADDGHDFVHAVEHELGITVNVVSGEEEARLAAQGVLHGLPHADGLLGDLGGGSLDLVVLNNGEYGEQASLPSGHLRLSEMAGGNLKLALKEMDRELATLPWIADAKGRTFFAVGGSWRNIGRVLIESTDYPLHVIDNFVVPRKQAVATLRAMVAMDPVQLETLSGASRRRSATLPFAAVAMLRVLEKARPRSVQFSGFGMREGQMLKSLDGDRRRSDPLISGCTALWQRTGRFSMRGEEMLDWSRPLFPEETRAERRLRLAACLLSDLGWVEHPDYRARHAFHRILRIPFAGMTHSDRVFLAIALIVRYDGTTSDELVTPVLPLVNPFQVERATGIGLALRLAHTISGSAPGILARTSLAREAGRLVLNLPDDRIFVGEAIERRFRDLARHLGLEAAVVTGEADGGAAA